MHCFESEPEYFKASLHDAFGVATAIDSLFSLQGVGMHDPLSVRLTRPANHRSLYRTRVTD
jgi:hypothetical protein